MAHVVELTEAFRDNNFELADASIAARCISLCTQFSLTDDGIVNEFEAFHLNKKLQSTTISQKQLDSFVEYLVRTHGKKNVKRVSGIKTYKGAFDLDDEAHVSYTASAPPSKKANLSFGGARVAVKAESAPAPGPGQSAMDLTTAKPGSNFSKRTQKGTVQVALNESIPPRSADAAPMAVDGEEESCRIDVLGALAESAPRFMFDRLEGKAAALEERILAFSAVVQKHLGLESLHPVHVASQEPVVVVGRVCCDSEGKLNAQSVVLEGSVKDSGGNRVKVDLSKVESYGIFPGQVVAVEGLNPGGHCLVASRVIGNMPLAMPPAPTEEEAAASVEATGGAGFSVLAASGPFCSTEDLAYEPLAALLAMAKEKRPDVLVLMGPFVDTDHPVVAAGAVDISAEQIFAKGPREMIEEYCREQGAGAKVLLMASPRDEAHDPVFPQAPMKPEDFDAAPGQIVCLPNPATVRVGGVVFGACTQPVLMHLAGNETEKAAPGADRIARLFGHVVGQRSFYPLFPPGPGAFLDVSLATSAAALPVTPDVLLLPSNLNPVAKKVAAELPGKTAGCAPEVLGQVICINPGRLTKGSTGGTCVHLHVAAPAVPEGAAEGAKPPPVVERVRVEIVRI